MSPPERRAVPRGPARPRHRPSRRAELVAAAIAEYGAAGPAPDPVSVAQIVARTRMGPSAFYYHFASTDELLTVVADELFAGFTGRFAAGPGEGAEAWAVAALARHVGWVRAEPARARVLVLLVGGPPGGPAVLAAVQARLAAAVSAVAATLGQLAPAPPLRAELVARGLVALALEAAAAAEEGTAELVAATEVLARRLIAEVTAPG